MLKKFTSPSLRFITSTCWLFPSLCKLYSIDHKVVTTYSSQIFPDFSKLLAMKNDVKYKPIDRNIGLMGLKNMFVPEDLRHFLEESRERCKELRNNIVSLGNQFYATPNISLDDRIAIARKILDLTDDISNTLCNFLDSMEFIRSVHQDKRFRNAATESYEKFATIMHELNCDAELHNTTKIIIDDNDVFACLNDMEKRCVTLLKYDMEKHGGVHEGSNKDAIVHLSSRIDVLCAEFNRSVNEEMQGEHDNDDYIVVTQTQAKEYPDVVRRINDPSRPGHKLSVIYKSNCGYISHYASDENLRRQAHILFNQANDKNLKLLDELIATRQKLAEELKRSSFAHAVLADQCATTPENAWSFLERMSAAVDHKARQELHILREIKSKDIKKDVSDVKINAWDIPYYTRMLRKTYHKSNVSGMMDYFPLHRCFEGLFMICDRLFGVRFEPMTMHDGESWHPSVRKFALTDRDSSLLGYFYVDLYSRKGKISSNANFSIRNAKTSINQKPISALVCSFSPSTSSNGVSLLTHSQVVTLFHEFGHALHVLLGQTPYQNLSGTRTAIDFVETPSHFMEHFAWDYRILKLFAHHHTTDEPLPETLLQRLIEERDIFCGLQIKDQIVHSMLDLALYSNDLFLPIRRDNLSTAEVYKRLTNKYHCVPFVEGTSEHGRFVHFSNYAAGYYSYLYCKVTSSHLWYKYFADDPLDSNAGYKYRTEFLGPGGSKDPNEIIQKVLGGQPDPQYLLRNVQNNVYH